MARQGFYEIKTFETLSREFGVNQHYYESFKKSSRTTDQVDNNEFNKQNGDDKKDAGLNKRTQKQKDKNMLVTGPKNESRGHTGFLTFAIKF